MTDPTTPTGPTPEVTPGAAGGLSPLEWTSPRDHRRAARPEVPALAELTEAGWVAAADVHVALRLRRLVGEEDPAVLAAVALTVRAAREGSSCLDLTALHTSLVDQGCGSDWLPATAADWADAAAASATVRAGLVHVEDGLVYLDRYHREERQIATDLVDRLAGGLAAVDEEALAAGLARVFVGDSWAEHRAAVDGAARRSTTVLVGGPGTGKTSTVAGLLTLVLEQAVAVEGSATIALAAPSGKAAARLRESVRESLARMPAADAARVGDVESFTLHRLLGWNPESRNRFRHQRGNPLPHDLVVVDEASMLSLTLMARLLEALRPDARLILVGDPDQLVSVEAGAVLADLVTGFGAWGAESPVVRLRTGHRFGAAIGGLADAVRLGHADEVMALLRGSDGAGDAAQPAASPDPGGRVVEYVEVGDPSAAHEALDDRLGEHAIRLREVALAGDLGRALTELGAHRLLCAHREGPWGVATWNTRIGHRVRQQTGTTDPAGRPLLVTANDYRLGLSNGDTGVIARDGDRLVAAFGEPDAPVVHGLTAVADVDTAHALTVHKSQGSQARHVTVLLPDASSRLLTRELLYTAVTRAQDRLTVVGSEAAIRRAVGSPTQRASGLHRRLAARPTDS